MAAGEVEPVTAYEAAERLDKAPPTIHLWALRYAARRLGKQGRKMYFDFADLAVIDREIRHGHAVPATWQARSAIAGCCPQRKAERTAEQFHAA